MVTKMSSNMDKHRVIGGIISVLDTGFHYILDWLMLKSISAFSVQEKYNSKRVVVVYTIDLFIVGLFTYFIDYSWCWCFILHQRFTGYAQFYCSIVLSKLQRCEREGCRASEMQCRKAREFNKHVCIVAH